MKYLLSILHLFLGLCLPGELYAQGQNSTDSLGLGLDSVRIYKDISEIRASFTPPTFNGGTVEQFEKMMYAVGIKVWKHIKGQNVKPSGLSSINIYIDIDGYVKDVEITESCYAVADSQMADYVRHIPRFSPGMINNQPIATRIEMEIDWNNGRAYYVYKPYNL